MKAPIRLIEVTAGYLAMKGEIRGPTSAKEEQNPVDGKP
jgi:hypothetical protein